MKIRKNIKERTYKRKEDKRKDYKRKEDNRKDYKRKEDNRKDYKRKDDKIYDKKKVMLAAWSDSYSSSDSKMIVMIFISWHVKIPLRIQKLLLR